MIRCGTYIGLLGSRGVVLVVVVDVSLMSTKKILWKILRSTPFASYTSIFPSYSAFIVVMQLVCDAAATGKEEVCTHVQKRLMVFIVLDAFFNLRVFCNKS